MPRPNRSFGSWPLFFPKRSTAFRKTYFRVPSGEARIRPGRFRLFKEDIEALFSFNNLSDFLSVGPGHMRQQLRNYGGTTFKQRVRPKPLPTTWVDLFANSHQSTRDLESIDSPGKLRTRGLKRYLIATVEDGTELKS